MKIGFMTHKHQYNTWQQMKTQGHICRKLTGMNIYLYVGRFLEVSQALPMYHAADPSIAPWIPFPNIHTHTVTPGSGFHFNMVAKLEQKPKGCYY